MNGKCFSDIQEPNYMCLEPALAGSDHSRRFQFRMKIKHKNCSRTLGCYVHQDFIVRKTTDTEQPFPTDFYCYLIKLRNDHHIWDQSVHMQVQVSGTANL